MAVFPLGAESVRLNPLPDIPARRAEIEALVERLIEALDLLDELDGYEDDNEDCCACLDDTGGYGLAFEAFGFCAAGDPDGAEGDGIYLPGALHGAFQDDEGRGWNCVYAAADALAYAPVIASRGAGGAA